tara:strand:+ start:201 stop:401 length:201 start_codon:yes stop_codon:yes gene_type:complete
LKNYNLDEIEPLFKECKEFLDGLVYSYKIQGVVIPDRLRNIRDKIGKQINNIERKDNVDTNNKRAV